MVNEPLVIGEAVVPHGSLTGPYSRVQPLGTVKVAVTESIDVVVPADVNAAEPDELQA